MNSLRGEYASGNVFLRFMEHKKGGGVVGDLHNFDHTSFFIAGRYAAKVFAPAVDDSGVPITDGKTKKQVWLVVMEQEFGPGEHALIRADHKHTFVALEDDSRMVCIYSHRDPQSGKVIKNYNGWTKAYT